MKITFARPHVVVLFMFFISLGAKAQTYVFTYDERELVEIQSTVALSKHPLGDEYAYKLQLLKETYTYEVPDEIHHTKQTIIEKPSIYFSVKKANKHLTKSVKKGRIEEEEATKKLTEILDKALNIRYQDTEQLEAKLWKVKDPEAITALYTEEISLN